MILKEIEGIVISVNKYLDNDNQVIKEYKIKISNDLSLDYQASYITDVLDVDWTIGQKVLVTFTIFNIDNQTSTWKIHYRIDKIQKGE